MRAPLLGRTAVFAALLALSTCLTGSHLCPRSLDCARAGRHFCLPGSSHCGACLRPLVENSHGRCVVRRRHAPHATQSTKAKVKSYPELDEEIDVLSAIISEQRTESRLPAPPAQDFSQTETGLTNGAATTARPQNHSVAFTSVAVPATTVNHTTGVLSEPVIFPYPSNDHVFVKMLRCRRLAPPHFITAINGAPQGIVGTRRRNQPVDAQLNSAAASHEPTSRSAVVSSVVIVAGSLALVIAGACWVRLQRGVGLTQKVDYPVYGLMRAQTFDNYPGDNKLAHSAQMYHYQHQKQQMLSLEKHRDEPKVPDSGASTDEENDDGDFTVYECPGLAPTGEMEVKNPLFDDSTLHFQQLYK